MPVHSVPLDSDFGLWTRDSRPIPLVAVAIEGTVRDSDGHLELRQVFRIRETVPIEAVYSFPVPENGGTSPARGTDRRERERGRSRKSCRSSPQGQRG